MSAPRPGKRPRQRLACEPCRRKKTRCPGEKPACSFCARLGQVCVYGSDVLHQGSSNPSTPNRAIMPLPEGSLPLEGRVQMLEARLAEVLGTVGQQQSRNSTVSLSSPEIAVNSMAPSSHPANHSSRFSASVLPPWEMVVEAAQTYLLYCDCQPLPLFHRDILISSLRSRDPEVLFSILALALRFSDQPFFRESQAELIDGYAETARILVMRRVSEGPVELSTLQSLCLLSLVDFTDGNKHRASIHSALAMNLAHCVGLTSESSFTLSELAIEERRRCFWSIFLLKRLHGADFSILDVSGKENFPRYPLSASSPSTRISDIERGVSPGSDTQSRKDGPKDKGILAYAMQLSDVWFQTTKYARRRATPSKLPPWSPQSEHATILAQQIEFETSVPLLHRFNPAEFAHKTAEELQQNRDYWGPWLFLQFLYHTNLCLLNHPLILALRLRNFKSIIPEIFLQNTSDLTSSHTTWIIHLINMVKAKSFHVTDPFLGHCAAIVATIHLQESFVEDLDVRNEKQTHFAKCLEFIRGIGQQWPHIARLAEKLQRLQDTVSASYHHRNANSQTPKRSLLIDLARFWEILEYSSAGELYDSAGQLFGPSLYLGPRNSTNEVSKTSTLPPPTRLGSAVLSDQDAESSSSQLMDEGPSRDTLAPAQRPDVPFTNFQYGNMAEQPYSNEELAVLADSFFNPRPDFSGMDDWWKTGNL